MIFQHQLIILLRAQVSVGDKRFARLTAEDLSLEKSECSAPSETAMTWQCRSLQVIRTCCSSASTLETSNLHALHA